MYYLLFVLGLYLIVGLFIAATGVYLEFQKYKRILHRIIVVCNYSAAIVAWPLFLLDDEDEKDDDIDKLTPA